MSFIIQTTSPSPARNLEHRFGGPGRDKRAGVDPDTPGTGQGRECLCGWDSLLGHGDRPQVNVCGTYTLPLSHRGRRPRKTPTLQNIGPFPYGSEGLPDRVK